MNKQDLGITECDWIIDGSSVSLGNSINRIKLLILIAPMFLFSCYAAHRKNDRQSNLLDSIFHHPGHGHYRLIDTNIKEIKGK